MSKEVNIRNVKKYFTGYTKRALDKLGLIPSYIKEQIQYRESMCGDCLEKGKCKGCGCKVPARWYNVESCNKGKRFGPLLDKSAWEDFKRMNNEK